MPLPKHGVDENEDGKHLRTVIAVEIREVMNKHNVGGCVLLCSPNSASWLTVFPKWAGLIPDAEFGMRIRINTRTPEAKIIADSTVGMIASMRDMCSDYANAFGRMYRQVVEALERQGAGVDQVPFSGRSHRPDPTRAEQELDAGTQRLVDDLSAKPQSFDRDEIIRRAKKLRYHAYKSDDATPTILLVKHLSSAGFKDLAEFAAADRYDQDATESRRWAEETPEGRELTAMLEADPAMQQQMTELLEAMGKAGKRIDTNAVIELLRKQGVSEKKRQD